MKHLIDIKNPEEFLDKVIKITLKIDGKPVQCGYEDGRLVFRGRGGDAFKEAKEITAYDLLYSVGLNKAVKHFKSHQENMKPYKNVICEVDDDGCIYLLSATGQDGKLIEDTHKVCEDLDFTVIPTLYDCKPGMIDPAIKHAILRWLKQDTLPTYANMLDVIYPNMHIDIEGIVLTTVDNEQAKLINPMMRSKRDMWTQHVNDFNLKYKEQIENAYKWIFSRAELTYEWLLQTDQLESSQVCKENLRLDILNHMFIEIVDLSTPAELFAIASAFPSIDRYRFFIQQENLPEELQALMREYPHLVKLYDLHIKMLWKKRKRTFLVTQEFQDEVNEFIEKIERRII